MGDSSSFTQAARNNFNKKHANLLNNKHTSTVKNIQDLQELEKYMFNNLQSLNKSGSNSAEEAELITKRINELSAMRLTLFRDLKTIYKDTQKQTHHNRGNLADQITMTKVVENELDNAKKQLKILKQDRVNKKRLAELGDYEYDRYSSHKNIVKVMAYGALGVLIFAFLMSFPWFPSMVGVAGICAIIGIVLITIFKATITNFARTNLYWHKFKFSKNAGGRGDSSRKGFEWSQLFSSTCDNIANKYTEVKNKLTNVKDRADLKVSAVSNSSESFGNIVEPSQPKGNESFHTIY
jgi:hypothetical protein